MIKYEKQPHPTVYGHKSQQCISELHSQLSAILDCLREDGWDISVICGYRDKAAQDEAFSSGNSKARWPTSKHNQDPSLAVDIAPWISGHGIEWKDPRPWIILAGAFMEKAQELDIKVRWGGLFHGLRDLGHFELSEIQE